MRWIDSHSHIDVTEFDTDRDEVIDRAHAAGVSDQIVPAVTAATWPELRETCARYPGLHAAYGLHPVYLQGHDESHLRALREWIERERPVAVGECGLDFFIEKLDRDMQQRFFAAQLALAREFDLPVVVHARRAVDAVIAAIRRFAPLRGVVHSFSGSREQATLLIRHGFLLGLGGPVTYERANRLRDVAAWMPLDSLLLETDAPDQPDIGHRGQRNEPARLALIGETIATLRRVDTQTVADATTANACRLFGIS